MDKNTVMMQDIIVKYHPLFVGKPDLINYGIANADIFNVERLIEQTMAAVGGYNFVDDAHQDFDDVANSDSKTASIRVNPAKAGTNSHHGEISGVTTAGGSLKVGALRCVIYNPHTCGLMYYFLPKYFWQTKINRHPTSGVGRIKFTYNRMYDTIPKLEGFECQSFEELACKV